MFVNMCDNVSNCVNMCVFVCECVYLCVNMCHIVSFCVILCHSVSYCVHLASHIARPRLRVPNWGGVLRVPNELFIKVSVSGCEVSYCVVSRPELGVPFGGVCVILCVKPYELMDSIEISYVKPYE